MPSRIFPVRFSSENGVSDKTLTRKPVSTNLTNDLQKCIVNFFSFPYNDFIKSCFSSPLLQEKERIMEKQNDFLMKPKVDFCFKELMTSETVRRGFLSALLSVSPSSIADSQILSPNLRKVHSDDKLGILDVKVLLTDGSQVNIEIQLAFQKSWAERTLFYICKMYSDQLNKGQRYDQLKKCIHIGILDFILYQDEEAFYSDFHLWEDEKHFLYSDQLEFHVLELPKLARYDYPETELLAWAHFLNAEKKEDMEKMAENNEYIKEAYDNLCRISADDEKRLEYEEREKAIRDYNNTMATCLEEGLRKGRQEGIQQWIQALILDNVEEEKSKDCILQKLQRRFSLDSQKAEEYYSLYTSS